MIFVYDRAGYDYSIGYNAVLQLCSQEKKRLWSRRRLANEISGAWHYAAGFMEIPDIDLAYLRATHADWELERLEQVGELTPETERALKAEKQRWEAEIERLSEKEEQNGRRSVHPTEWFYDF